MNLTRRDLAAAGFALSATTLIVPAMAATDDQETVKQAVEALRKAILAQDRPKLETLTAEQLSYSHSSARVLRRGTKSSACLPSTISGGSHWSASRLIRSHRRRRPSPSAGGLRPPCLGELHRPPPARALIEGVGFAADSPLEGTGFELSVPLQGCAGREAVAATGVVIIRHGQYRAKPWSGDDRADASPISRFCSGC